MSNPFVFKNIITGKKSFKNVYSLLFDGVSEALNIDSTRTSLATTTVGTLAGWIKMPNAATGTSRAIISFGDTDLNNDMLFYMDTGNLLGMQARSAGVALWLLQTDANPFTNNVWAHIAIVQNGTSPVIYVNGTSPAQTFTIGTNKTIWFNDLSLLDNGRIACRNFNGGGDTLFVNAYIDEVSIWNTNLSAAQITELYNNGKPGNLKKHSAFSNLNMWIRGDGATYDGTNFTFPNSSGNNSNTSTSINMELADLVNDVP